MKSSILYLLVLLAVFSTMALADVVSRNYRGQCWSYSNCRAVCRDEGYVSGHCNYFGGACWCAS
ncbi:hypothetical protein CRE_14288 [Caenorhabditis remanei]|uniref:Mycin-3 n=1 Tax=Caenorhabditis remanei TaxID=31234 RepID=E3NBU0_CAERE|nr:mycin-3 precursor [Caenorhabditis remanei]EFO92498.1 hypothetical protein CRE_14288 [Caenorhabditis remanei]